MKSVRNAAGAVALSLVLIGPATAQTLADSTVQVSKQWAECVEFQHEMQVITEEKEALKMNAELAFCACASEELAALSAIGLLFQSDQPRRRAVAEHYVRRMSLKRKLVDRMIAPANKSR
jgi:hypothetical protein